MEEKKFTLRLTSSEVEELEKLKDIVGEKTNTGTIKRIINQYPLLNKRYNDLWIKNCSLQEKYDEKCEKVDNFLNALKELQ